MQTISLQAIEGMLSVSKDVLALSFPVAHPSLSTAIWNGGYRQIRHACNERLTVYCNREKDFPGGSVPAYLALSLEEQGFPPKESSALLTSADVSKYAHVVKEHHGLIVETIATGGVGRTAARAGSPAIYEEHNGDYFPIGTLNIITTVNGCLPEGIMARALITITEGKTAALQDLGIADANNGKVATGTATDGITLITSEKASPYTDAGTFSDLGYLLSSTTYEAIQECITRFDKPKNCFASLVTPPAVDMSVLKELYPDGEY